MVIIGAGVAGIEAARTLCGKGVSFVMVEANNRVGGRVGKKTYQIYTRATG
ncbi:MAG: NAD(P)-binding protein [Gammaproteobacteria bacterium]|nr:NAD(P)-binding protein [Gammaproteobacteria bacterium]